MEKKPTSSTDYEQLTTGLKAFFRIVREWELNRDQTRRLLGTPSFDALSKWESGKISHDAVSTDLLDRLSYILGIYKSLKIMHSTENQKLFLTNTTQLARFKFSSPIEYMLTGHLEALADVRKYLDDQRLKLSQICVDG